MDSQKKAAPVLQTALEPWLTVNDAKSATAFYKAAFDAAETYRMEDPGGGLVVKLMVDGAGFWVSGDGTEQKRSNAASTPSIKFVLTVTDPDAMFAKTIAAGATEVFPVGEAYGWRLGRITDPFGFDWELGRPLQ